MSCARYLHLVLLVGLFEVPVMAQEAMIGETTFETSAEPEAHKAFMRGLLLLHSFEYEDSRSAFLEAQERDPNFALAYWGEAMTHNHPVWMLQDTEAARAVLNRLAPTLEGRLAKAPTERERAYLRTADVLFFGEGDKHARDDAYAEAMADLAATYPDDLDAIAFHALAILGTSHEGRDFRTYMRAAATAQPVFDANPRHPGAAHYIIHSFDDPIHAPLGLPAANAFANIAPASSHALHMPTHIYFAFGMWDEAETLNQRSYDVADERTSRKNAPLDRHGYHAFRWLVYGHLQQGRYDAARALVEQARDRWREEESTPAERSYRDACEYYLAETGRWADGLCEEALALESDWANTAYVRGLSALATGNIAGAEEAAGSVGPGSLVPRKRSASLAQVTQAELKALIALARGDAEAAVMHLEEATALEDAMPLDFGPVEPVKPSHELFGEVLLDLDRPADAQVEFERALERAPRRALSLLGLARAAVRTGDHDTAHAAAADLAAVWSRADAGARARLAEVERTLPDQSGGH